MPLPLRPLLIETWNRFKRDGQRKRYSTQKRQSFVGVKCARTDRPGGRESPRLHTCEPPASTFPPSTFSLSVLLHCFKLPVEIRRAGACKLLVGESSSFCRHASQSTSVFLLAFASSRRTCWNKFLWESTPCAGSVQPTEGCNVTYQCLKVTCTSK